MDGSGRVKRVALRAEPLDRVFPSPEDAATLSFVITGHLLGVFHLANEEWWEFLNRIEEAYELAKAADLDLLPALMLRARRVTTSSTPDTAQR